MRKYLVKLKPPLPISKTTNLAKGIYEKERCLKALEHRQFRQIHVLTVGVLLAWVLQIQAATQIAGKIEIYGISVPRSQMALTIYLS